jgi:hypothetical protein
LNGSERPLDGRLKVWSCATQSGSAKGLWHHGKRIAAGKKGTYVVTGWVKDSAFCD